MTYSYIRVSTDKQTTQNQKFEIANFARNKGMRVDEWIVETASGIKKACDRKLGSLLGTGKKGDVILVSELSRLGRNLMQIMGTLNFCMESGVKIIAVKENYELGDNINSKVLAFAFGLSAEIERNLISMRTKEALARRRAEGFALGRPKDGKSLKLNGREDAVRGMISKGLSKTEIMRRVGVSRPTLNNFIRVKKLSMHA